MSIQKKAEVFLYNKGADFIHFVDISALPSIQNKNYPTAILFGIAISPVFIQKVSENPDYVKELKENNLIEEDEFHHTEKKTDLLADQITEFLQLKGYSAYSQSENNIYETGFYNEKMKSTPLPHKTIAGMAGLGWIGNHNLLVTNKYGSAISMCSVLTNAPFNTSYSKPEASRCGSCSICMDICEEDAIKGEHWIKGKSREKLIDVNRCTTCLKCMALCSWTQKYAGNELNIE